MGDLTKLLDEWEHSNRENGVQCRHCRLIDAVRAGLALADELEVEAAERDRMAERLPNTPSYHMEINRLSVAANHQARASRQFRHALTAALTPEAAS